MRRTEPDPSPGLTPALLTLPVPAPVSAQSPTPLSGRPAHPGA